MRILLLTAAAALLPQASAASPPQGGDKTQSPAILSALPAPHSECRTPTSYIARGGLTWRDGNLQPRKLTELPPARGYMAVYRVVNGCEDPMTMVEYRTGEKR